MKIIALGNYIMADDSIALRVAERLKKDLQSLNAIVIIGETDIDFCISQICDNDTLFILDASFFNKEPGSITYIPINEFKFYNSNFYSQHQINFIKLLQFSKILVKGYIIGIEIFEIKLSLHLSDMLQNKLDEICSNTFDIIKTLSENT